VAFLELHQVAYTYPGWPPVVQGVDWTLPEGEFHCLVGRSGCGKTTWLKLAAGLLMPDAGSLRLQGQVLKGPTPSMGFVFQSPTLLPWLSVLDNVLLPITLHRAARREDEAHALDLLARMGLSALAQQRPPQLSGGQQSRVAIARALVTRPHLLLMDEPFAALDAITREELQNDLLAVCQAQGLTVVFVTHSIYESVYLSSRVVVMSARPGRIVADIPMADPHTRTPEYRLAPLYGERCRTVRAALLGQEPRPERITP